MRRHDEQQRIALRLRHSSQGLHGFAQTHLIRQQRARGVAKIGRALALKIHQRTLEECRRRIDALRRLPCALPRPCKLPRTLQRFLPAQGVGFANAQRVAQHQPVEIAGVAPVGGKPRYAAPLTVAAWKEPLGHLADRRLPFDDPGPAAAVIAQFAVSAHPALAILAQIRRKNQIVRQFGQLVIRIVIAHPTATPQSRFSATTRQGLPQTVCGSSAVRSTTRIKAFTCGRDA